MTETTEVQAEPMPTPEVWAVDMEYAISPAQGAFVDDETNRYPAYVTGYGGGKTYAGLIKSIDLSVVNIGLPMLLIEPTYRMFGRVMWPTLFDQILDPRGIPYQLNKSDMTLRFHWGSEFWFQSAENPHRLVGDTVAAGYMDEAGLSAEKAWRNAAARVRHARATLQQMFATFTPEVPGWTHERWGAQELSGEPLRKGYALYQGRTGENWTLGPEYEQQLLSEWDADEARARVFGSFRLSSVGRVYRAFSRSNICPVRTRLDPKRPLYLSFDFNEVPGMHVLACQRQESNFAVVGEIFRKGLKLEDACIEALKRYGQRQLAPVVVTGDATGRHSASQKGYYQIINDIFRNGYDKNGVGMIGFTGGLDRKVPRGNPSVSDSVAATNALLCNAQGNRQLFVNPDCKRLLADLERLITVAEKRKQIGKAYYGPYEIDKSDQNLSHAGDCLRYWVWQVRPLRTTFARQLDYKVGA